MFGIKRLRRHNAAMREALAWYADSDNWRRSAINAKGDPLKWIKSPAAFDRGARAKFILSQTEATLVAAPRAGVRMTMDAMEPPLVAVPFTPLPRTDDTE